MRNEYPSSENFNNQVNHARIRNNVKQLNQKFRKHNKPKFAPRQMTPNIQDSNSDEDFTQLGRPQNTVLPRANLASAKVGN